MRDIKNVHPNESIMGIPLSDVENDNRAITFAKEQIF